MFCCYSIKNKDNKFYSYNSSLLLVWIEFYWVKVLVQLWNLRTELLLVRIGSVHEIPERFAPEKEMF